MRDPLPLDYAPPPRPDEPPPRRVGGSASVGRSIGSVAVALCGVLMLDASRTAARNSGGFVVVLGLALFVFEFVTSWLRDRR